MVVGTSEGQVNFMSFDSYLASLQRILIVFCYVEQKFLPQNIVNRAERHGKGGNLGMDRRQPTDQRVSSAKGDILVIPQKIVTSGLL